ncbi:aminomethyltransferase family protein [Hyphomicrobium sp.]|uniref:aminomethyltransferase family protein n=1 Tax=Hyphomicrobium sp. TaxID=82 RepID=UPI002E379172|nr:aminomethyltransferase family protein [Hyphomicrobium sp.]HEX2840035.1 aminomethyltransferase family protein [Hyphomicrobium sp.]
MPATPRRSALEQRHRELGSDLSNSWNGMPLAQRYKSDPYEEIAATRYRAGLIDVSALNIVNVSGSQATEFLNYIFTSDISKMNAGDSQISNPVNEEGGIIDDALLYCDGPNQFRISHGGGKLFEEMQALKKGYDVTFEQDMDVHVLALQGPASKAILSSHTDVDLAKLVYFKHASGKLFGRDVSIARGGYSGELGFEVFCKAADAVAIWDSILAAGRSAGVAPVSWDCLDIGRVEAGLLFFPCEMPMQNTTPWEVRADWTVDLDKADFRGKDALSKRRGKERSFVTGLEINSETAVSPGSPLFSDGKKVGVITTAAFSRHLMKSLALAQVEPNFTALGTPLVVQDNGNEIEATVVRMPFYDPLRLRTHPRSQRID